MAVKPKSTYQELREWEVREWDGIEMGQRIVIQRSDEIATVMKICRYHSGQVVFTVLIDSGEIAELSRSEIRP